MKAGLEVGALKGGWGGHQEGSEALLCQVSAIRLLSVHQDGGEAGPLDAVQELLLGLLLVLEL
jgi:hypothetical protein